MNKQLKRRYRKLRKDLRGKYNDIAKECEVSKSTVSSVLNGVFENEKVFQTALIMREKVLADRQIELENISNRINA